MIRAKGYAAQTPISPLVPWDFDRRELDAHDVQIDILYCGVCHTDYHQLKNDWYPGLFPMVPGHEIVGRVVATGKGATKFEVGNLAAVGTMVDSCRSCPDCENHHEQCCSVGAVWTYNSLGKDGLPTYGGYSNTLVVHEDFAFHVSEQLDLSGVGPLLCAGITTYSPLRRFNVGKGHKLAVVGLGGLGHLAVKFGVAFGAEVTVLSTSASKADDALKLGAHHFVVTSDAAQFGAVKGSFDFILDCISATHDLNSYLTLLKTNGVHVCIGVPVEPYQLSPFSLLAGNKSVVGSGTGGLLETQEMLDFCAEHNIVSDVEVIAIGYIHTAFERMLKGDVRYRFVIDVATL
jgi:uncharacterized zinc-type alcohol dehydrogenase-like protein